MQREFVDIDNADFNQELVRGFVFVEFTNRPKCEHTLEQSYSGMYSIFQHFPMLCIPFLPIAMVV